MKTKLLIRGSVLVIQTAIFPYYLLFLKNIGENYSAFSLLYAIFALSSAACFYALTWIPSRLPLDKMYSVSLFGLGLTMISVPFTKNIFHVCLIQCFMGIFQALYKLSEKEFDIKNNLSWKKENIHQFILQLIIVASILGAGFVFDWFSVHMLFYLAGAWYMVNSWLALKREEIVQ
ncbi:hypothetical protein SAMN05444673_3142 [Bacillus sp. OV166]|uniref:hypothetical protein n=1 Tax=Bacillus sp. OV166 TaxID=1882763 RepID=UPI000A2AD3FF|nr:hypothetical protein [Bacillus sp. OV166]SMQ77921.1 hypothetical protein SAMN05444673_3142 [Bacillus sp. OV166]